MSKPRRGFSEFLLLVLGVFIALAGENWVAGRSERALASDYTRDLVSDLLEDSTRQSGQVRNTMARIEALDALLADLNGDGPHLDATTQFAALLMAQSVPEPQFQTTTYRDLASTGNLRLLDAGLRRAVVEYHSELEGLRGVIERNGGEKPPFADLVPGRSRTALRGECRPLDVALSADCLEELQAEVSALTSPELTAVASWREMAGIRLQLERAMHMSLRYLARFDNVDAARQRALTVVRGTAW